MNQVGCSGFPLVPVMPISFNFFEGSPKYFVIRNGRYWVVFVLSVMRKKKFFDLAFNLFLKFSFLKKFFTNKVFRLKDDVYIIIKNSKQYKLIRFQETVYF